MKVPLRRWLETRSRYLGYSYAYPHKTAYRPLDPAPPLRDVWRSEDKTALFLYLHVPYCEVRCGFCNLFATIGAGDAEVARYLDALERQARAVADALGPERRFARFAVGGGTPSYLAPAALERLFWVAEEVLGVNSVPTSFELAPSSADEARLSVLAEHGVDRVSIGVQSFDEEEVRALGRPQRRADAIGALERLKRRGFPTLNIDLIYGGDGMGRASWLRSIEQALAFEPEELYLYPLYVRRLTGLSRRGQRPEDEARRDLYRAGRDALLARGYEQVSMRMFRRRDAAGVAGPAYCCQRDGMVGLGAGARSYTRALHYSSEYAVGRVGVRAILEGYLEQSSFGRAAYGIALDDGERRRRWVIQSLLLCEGMSLADYERAFGSEVLEDLPELTELLELDLAAVRGGRLVLDPEGIALSDAIGPWLASEAVASRMEGFAWR